MTSSQELAKFPYECVVINLDRQPERLAEFREWNDGCGLDIERFPATDGATLDEATRRTVSTSDRLTRGMIGSALSHKRLWERVIETARPMVIFEDDAVLRGDIAGVLPSVLAQVRARGFWDIILLGFNTNTRVHLHPGETLQAPLKISIYPTREELVAHKNVQTTVVPYRLTHAFGICGYVLSPIGAKKLLEQCFPIDDRLIFPPGLKKPLIVTTVDTMMYSIYASIAAYVCLPPLVLTPNDPSTSTTLKP